MTLTSIQQDGIQTVLIIAPHPDDDVLSVGGTAQKMLSEGFRVKCIILTRGELGGADGATREREAIAALGCLGVPACDIHFGPFADGHITFCHGTISFLEAFAGPEVVAAFIPPVEDHHQDHHYCARACLSALRRVPSLLMYKTPSALAFTPNVFVRLTEQQVAKKWEAIQHHRSQAMQQKVFFEYNAFNRDVESMGLPVRERFAEGFKSVRYLLEPCPVRSPQEDAVAGNSPTDDSLESISHPAAPKPTPPMERKSDA